jgi:activator of HSP90 ATPase
VSDTIHQEVLIKAAPQQVYAALTDAKKFSEFTGAPAEINPESGGQFSCFDGMITGQTIELIPGVMLVQAWRVGNWEASVYSIVKFELIKISDAETKLIFDHKGFPDEHREHLEQGWYDRYWEPLKTYLNT